mmetsp:Transcript_50266/g.98983  ORF Transcript_50266/g.98983 Transcript_50266/m.98983 type:complete len:135 (-) Transcript_50266:223-627(-)
MRSRETREVRLQWIPRKELTASSLLFRRQSLEGKRGGRGGDVGVSLVPSPLGESSGRRSCLSVRVSGLCRQEKGASFLFLHTQMYTSRLIDLDGPLDGPPIDESTNRLEEIKEMRFVGVVFFEWQQLADRQREG